MHPTSQSLDLARWTYYLLACLAAFMPFEDFILKFIPGPETIYLASRFISEMAIYGAFSLIVFHKIMQKLPFSPTPVDVPVLLLAATTVLSLATNSSDPIQGLIDIRPVFRYVVLFYLVANTPLSPLQVNRILIIIVAAGSLQVMIGLAQFATGGALDPFLAPREVLIEVAGKSLHSRVIEGTREIGAIYGAASDTIFYAIFMNVVFVICLGKIRTSILLGLSRIHRNKGERADNKIHMFCKIDIWLIVIIPFIVLANALTYVRASLLIIITTAALELYYWLGRRISLTVAAGAAILLVFTLTAYPPNWEGGGATKVQKNPIEDFTSIFTIEYLKANLQNQRLHQLVGITPTVLLSNPLLGFGPVSTDTVDAINSARPSFLSRKIEQTEFKDVYWVSILAKYGIAGLVALIWIFYRLFHSAKLVYNHSNSIAEKEISLIVMYMMVTASLLLFFNRSYELRICGFYLWFLPGLMFSLVNYRRNPFKA